MKQEMILRRNIAVGQKIPGQGGPFGEGFNYSVEAGFPLAADREKCLLALRKVLTVIDHKALGVDVDLGFAPTTAALCIYIATEIQKSAALVSLRVLRGDGLVASLSDFV